jgi:hypothetical protein
MYESYGFIQKELPEEIKKLFEDYWYIYIFYELTLKKLRQGPV